MNLALDISDLFLVDYGYRDWFVPLLQIDEKVPPMPPLEGDDKVKEWKGLKILILIKLLTWLSVTLTQRKARNNSYKLKS